MKVSGAWLAVRALEEVGVKFTFGIPGVHNTELYDALAQSEKITPILVTHEGSASFMADGISRTSDSIGCLAIVPAAGLTHAMSGIGEAFLDGVPMLVITGGIRRDTGRHYQLHDIDQLGLAKAITKAQFLIDRHDKVVSTIYEAYSIATSGEPGPVLIELSGDVQLFSGEAEGVTPFSEWKHAALPAIDEAALEKALALLTTAKNPGLYLGWGAREATREMITIAEKLGTPVALTMQGLSVFPADHPLHTAMGFGRAALPVARNAFADCDALLAVGVRFAELATGSFSADVPKNLVHVDINRNVFDKNYPTAVAIEADAKQFAEKFTAKLQGHTAPDRSALKAQIAKDKAAFKASWKTSADKVSPGNFFASLRQALARDAYVVLDDGNHTFLAAELFPVYESKHLISPTDFNCMGYCVPATIATKLAHPDKQVVAVVGDGAFLMTGMEILTAATHGVGCVFFVFHDGELGQISQFQHVPLKYKTCTVIGDVRFEGVATATGAAYIRVENDAGCKQAISEALALADKGAPVIVDVNIDYSRKSEFTQGVIKTNLARFPLDQKIRFIARAAKRHTIG